ncbi:hypothetical protein K438DRAFT_1762501 [Mycena galopus ATCC 62051]|nr:hypothetical protein K438DRAFT_1762501 [Mycena galopus ATCC 62051]
MSWAGCFPLRGLIEVVGTRQERVQDALSSLWAVAMVVIYLVSSNLPHFNSICLKSPDSTSHEGPSQVFPLQSACLIKFQPTAYQAVSGRIKCYQVQPIGYQAASSEVRFTQIYQHSSNLVRVVRSDQRVSGLIRSKTRCSGYSAVSCRAARWFKHRYSQFIGRIEI